MENLVIRDWLSVTFKSLSALEVKSLIGMDNVPFIETKGARGYRDRLYFEGISIHSNGRPDMGTWLEMSGSGCRTFETYSTKNWVCLFHDFSEHNPHYTRLDIAFDDHTGIFEIGQVVSDTQCGLFVSRSEYWETVLSSKGTSVFIGSPQSEVRIRIYDKAAERGLAGSHWNRIEIQLRDDRAAAFIDLNMNIGEAFCGVLLNYLRFVVPDPDDSNKSRWEMTDYWKAVIDDASKISIFRSPGVEYNEEKLKYNIQNRWGNAIDTAVKLYGWNGFKHLIDSRETVLSAKYQALIDKHNLERIFPV